MFSQERLMWVVESTVKSARWHIFATIWQCTTGDPASGQLGKTWLSNRPGSAKYWVPQLQLLLRIKFYKTNRTIYCTQLHRPICSGKRSRHEPLVQLHEWLYQFGQQLSRMLMVKFIAQAFRILWNSWPMKLDSSNVLYICSSLLADVGWDFVSNSVTIWPTRILPFPW